MIDEKKVRPIAVMRFDVDPEDIYKQFNTSGLLLASQQHYSALVTLVCAENSVIAMSRALTEKDAILAEMEKKLVWQQSESLRVTGEKDALRHESERKLAEELRTIQDRNQKIRELQDQVRELKNRRGRGGRREQGGLTARPAG